MMRTIPLACLLLPLSALAATAGRAQASGAVQARVQVVDFRPVTPLVQAALRLRPEPRRGRHLQRRDVAGTTIFIERPAQAADTAARRVTIIHW